MKIERGVMVVKDGKAWGTRYADGQCTAYGWVDIEDAPIHDPEFCTEVTDVTWKDSPYVKELLHGKLLNVERRTEVIIL